MPCSWQSLFSSWQHRPCSVLRCAVIRHAERADADNVWFQEPWAMTKDAQMWPYDPPLSDRGREEALRVATSDVPGWTGITGDCLVRESWVVVSSPYFRCVQTAVQLCASLGPNAVLLVDNQLGEMYGPETMGEIEPTSVIRPSGETWTYCKSHNVNYRSKIVGQWPIWPEYVVQMRTRILSCFLKYLRRSSMARRNFVLVTHADGVAAALAVMPAIQGRPIEKVNFCGFFVASTPFYASDSKARDAARLASMAFCTTQLDTGEDDADEPSSASPPVSPSALKATGGWEVHVSGVQVGPRHRRRSLFTRLRNLTKRTGFKESEVATLLRCLPDHAMEEVIAYDAATSIGGDQHRCNSPSSDCDMSLSTYLFGASEIASSSLGSHIHGSSDGSRRPSSVPYGSSEGSRRASNVPYDSSDGSRRGSNVTTASNSSRVDTEIGSPKVCHPPRQFRNAADAHRHKLLQPSNPSCANISVGQVSSIAQSLSFILPCSPEESPANVHTDIERTISLPQTSHLTLLERRGLQPPVLPPVLKAAGYGQKDNDTTAGFSPVGNSTLLQRRGLQPPFSRPSFLKTQSRLV